MKETIKIEFDEAQKAVTAHVKIEVDFESVSAPDIRDALLLEAQRLFNKATEYSRVKTLEKNM
jgi:capsule polysaccharide export protein KpsE/RkpR